MERGALRADLFYRLNVVNVHLPALRERREDIALLVDHFLSKLSLRRYEGRLQLQAGRWSCCGGIPGRATCGRWKRAAQGGGDLPRRRHHGR
ncbi:hypothetical protein HS125_09490 [bacterium]|nr:hypothetical protein [bacterium]